MKQPCPQIRITVDRPAGRFLSPGLDFEGCLHGVSDIFPASLWTEPQHAAAPWWLHSNTAARHWFTGFAPNKLQVGRRRAKTNTKQSHFNLSLGCCRVIRLISKKLLPGRVRNDCWWLFCPKLWVIQGDRGWTNRKRGDGRTQELVQTLTEKTWCESNRIQQKADDCVFYRDLTVEVNRVWVA